MRLGEFERIERLFAPLTTKARVRSALETTALSYQHSWKTPAGPSPPTPW